MSEALKIAIDLTIGIALFTITAVTAVAAGDWIITKITEKKNGRQ